MPDPKEVNLLRHDIEEEVRKELGRAIGLLGKASTTARRAIQRRAELGEPAAGVTVPDPAAIDGARADVEGLL